MVIFSSLQSWLRSIFIHTNSYEQDVYHASHVMHVRQVVIIHYMHIMTSHIQHMHLFKERETNHQGIDWWNQTINQTVDQDGSYAKCLVLQSWSQGFKPKFGNKYYPVIEHANFGKILYFQYKKTCSHHILLLLESLSLVRVQTLLVHSLNGLMHQVRTIRHHVNCECIT